MSQAATSKEFSPSRDEFAALLAESLSKEDLFEGSVVKGKVVGIEKDLAVIDVGLKTEGRVALKEFAGPGRQNEIKIGDTVEVTTPTLPGRYGMGFLRASSKRPSFWSFSFSR